MVLETDPGLVDLAQGRPVVKEEGLDPVQLVDLTEIVVVAELLLTDADQVKVAAVPAAAEVDINLYVILNLFQDLYSSNEVRSFLKKIIVVLSPTKVEVSLTL
ncbi:hypothetical protein A2111_03460 [Candidatus Daviesbacteria bacterium GWA1_38_6]|nr:MAG: hypothetical protein A2111_03460 [Candidatus Daviesbacteria bacterium GWA1_38_6]